MKYLFIILIAFSFIGCDGEDISPTSKTMYATYTIPINTDIYAINFSAPGSFVQENSGDMNTPLPSGITLTTQPVVFVTPANILCSVVLFGTSTSLQTIEGEMNLYVDDQLYETRDMTGPGQQTFIVE
tara:strand:+ start:337 stop:720 length:384 start_codon:yes stop_codon:yes gene_type:complete